MQNQQSAFVQHRQNVTHATTPDLLITGDGVEAEARYQQIVKAVPIRTQRMSPTGITHVKVADDLTGLILAPLDAPHLRRLAFAAQDVVSEAVPVIVAIRA